MNMKRFTAILILFSANALCGLAQMISQPNYALKSHETLEISYIEISPASTIIYMTLENRISGGNFCADRNIYMIDPDGERLLLKKTAGIPVCPDIYSFKSIGEKIQFSLEFPELKADTKWFDLIEDCSSNCFWFYGVTLDNDLNKRIDEAFSIASNGKAEDNIAIFEKLLNGIDNQNLGIEGLLYINIINAAVENTDQVNARVWYSRLTNSHAPRVEQYLKYLNDRGIKY